MAHSGTAHQHGCARAISLPTRRRLAHPKTHLPEPLPWERPHTRARFSLLSINPHSGSAAHVLISPTRRGPRLLHWELPNRRPLAHRRDVVADRNRQQPQDVAGGDPADGTHDGVAGVAGLHLIAQKLIMWPIRPWKHSCSASDIVG